MKIPRSEFTTRLHRIQDILGQRQLDGLMVYGDEYRKENLRYVCDFWPIFERGMLFIPKTGQPIFAGAPEGEKYAREQCVWDDIRNVRDFACVSVPDAIDYPLATFSTFQEILQETLRGGRRIGLVGSFDLPGYLSERLKNATPSVDIVAADDILHKLRIIKSAAEIACLREAGRIAGVGYQALIKAAVPGNTERQAAGAAEGAARAAGAEDINFMVFGSGKRAETIIGRAEEKVIEDGDMIMAAMAVQYAGYVATVEYPFVAGRATAGQKDFLRGLQKAANVQYEMLKPGLRAGDMVKAVKRVFAEAGMTQYDVYPPMHGIGLAEAESPYPDVDSDYPFEVGMCVNSDISLFGHPNGSNRIEEGFVFTPDGVESLTPVIRQLLQKGI
ncbi:MAG TPA: Xaa-Pro peptidase family protein [Lentisphaeria bacterium]|nr:Xaa-Pro peptidase family protein [Lentisphaeria bacterium]